MSKTKVTLLPSHPAEGWPSMNRYWDALDRCSSAYTGTDFEFSCPLESEGILSKRAGRLKLAYEKKISYPMKVRAIKSGIVHILDHSYSFLLSSVPRGVKTIVTVHDLLPLREPEGLSENSIARFRSRVEWVKKADIVISDSLSTSNDLVELIGLRPERIQTLPLGTDRVNPDGNSVKTSPVPGKFIFSIGGYMKRKNLEILPKVLEAVRKRHPEIKLVRAGGKLPEELAGEFERRCGSDALVELGSVSDEALAGLYETAAVTIIPSRYEGFGLPVLEALARRCPVVCARTTSLPEVGGEAALYYEVDDAEEAARQVLGILDADVLSLEQRKQMGTDRASHFTWDRHFEKLLKIYHQLGVSATA